jgi:hypothetical protein
MHELNAFEVARIVGCRPQEVAGLLRGGPATLDVAEQLAMKRYRWKAHVDDVDSYWVTVKQAAQILGVSIQRVKHYLDNDKLPYVTHRNGVRLMRTGPARDCCECA